MPIFLSLVLANGISLVFLFLNISWKDLFKSRKSWNPQQGKQLITYSLPLIPNSAMWWILTTSSRFIMTFFLGVASNGMYAAASKIPSLLSVIGSIFLQAWQLTAVENYRQKDAGVFYQKVFNHYCTLLLVFSSLILLFLDPLASLLLSKEFYFAKAYIPLLLVSKFFLLYFWFSRHNLYRGEENKRCLNDFFSRSSSQFCWKYSAYTADRNQRGFDRFRTGFFHHLLFTKKGNESVDGKYVSNKTNAASVWAVGFTNIS